MHEAWHRDAQYLLLEGYSYPSGGHSHRDQNSIIRLNHLGRIWLVNNSYGKSEKQQGAAALYNTRQTGPEDHNTVQFIKADGSFAAYPALCALDLCRDYGSFVVVQSSLHGVAAGDWQRSVLWVKGTVQAKSKNSGISPSGQDGHGRTTIRTVAAIADRGSALQNSCYVELNITGILHLWRTFYARARS